MLHKCPVNNVQCYINVQSWHKKYLKYTCLDSAQKTRGGSVKDQQCKQCRDIQANDKRIQIGSISDQCKESLEVRGSGPVAAIVRLECYLILARRSCMLLDRQIDR